MTAKVSTSNFSTNFKYKVKSNFRIMIIIFILHLVAAPLNLINLIVYLNSKKNTDISSFGFNELYPIIGVITTGLAAVSGIIIAMNLYNYLYKKSVVDMTLSLPLTTKQRFFSDFLAGIFTYLVPFLASSIIALIINGIGSAVIPDWSFSVYGDITTSLITLIVDGFFCMLMVYVLTVLVLSCCGSMFESLAYTVILNGLIPGTIAVFGYIFIGNLFGIDASTNILPIIEKTSPISGLIHLTSSTVNGSANMLEIKISWLIPFIIITGIYFAGSYFLYMKRKAESVSKPFVYKAFYYVMITGITFCIGTLFTMGGRSKNIIPLIIITAVIYLIFEVITNRGFKKFYMSVIRYVITIVAVVGISYLFEVTEGFGAVTKIPDADNVKSVEMNYTGVFNTNIYNDNDKLTVYTDRNTIKSVVKMHRMVIDNYNEQKNEGYNNLNNRLNNKTYYPNESGTVGLGTYYTIKYNLKNGSSITRNYVLNFDEFIQLIKVDRTDELINRYIYHISPSYIRNNTSNSITSINVRSPIFESDSSKTKLTDSMVNDLLNCMKTDIKSMSDDEYYTSDKDTLAVLNFDIYNTDYDNYTGRDFYINENYVNTLMFLKTNNIRIPSSSFDVNDFKVYNNKMIIYAPETVGTEVDGKTYYPTINGYNAYQGNETQFISDSSDELLQILPHLRADYIATEPCYRIDVNGKAFTVPPQYKDLAYKVYLVAKEQNNDSDSQKYIEKAMAG